MASLLNWFEIPVADFDRAQRFYEALLGHGVERMALGALTMGMLSSDPAVAGGAIVHDPQNTPSVTGTVVYLNAGEDLAPMLARGEAAGGRVLVPKTEIGNGFGYFAHLLDTEGNRVGLHSMG